MTTVVTNPGSALSCSTKVGNVFLPDLPPGWTVTLDTEGSGLYVDGDPGTRTKPAAPKARVSAVSIAFRDPDTGQIVDYAWPFDQGPVLGKPGKPIRDPVTYVQTMPPITQAQQDAILSKFRVQLDPGGNPVRDDNGELVILLGAKPTKDNRPLDSEVACDNLPPEDYQRLINWLDERDVLELQNAKYDAHIFRVGCRADAGGFGGAEGFGAWNMDSPVGQWKHRDDPQALKDQTDQQGVVVRVIRDTMLGQGLLDPLETSALKPTSKRLFGEDEADEQAAMQLGLKQQGVGLTKRYDLLPWPLMVKYAAKDANQTLRVGEYQDNCRAQGAVPPHFDKLWQLEHDLMLTLYRMECRGVSYRQAESLEEGRKLRALALEMADLMPFDPSKIQQVKKFYFGLKEEGNLGLIPTEVTEKTQSPKLDEAEVRRLVKEGHAWAKEYDEYSHLMSSIAKWYDGWGLRTGDDGRIRANFRQGRIESDRPGQTAGGAISGRLSVERWQCQAIPHDHQLPEGATSVRQLIVAAPGKKLWEMDLPQGEVRIATVLANCKTMWDIVDSGEDLHGATATTIFGVHKGEPKFKELRGVAKRIVFGTLYGAGVMVLREQVRVFVGLDYSVAEMKAMVDEFKSKFPEFVKLADGCMKKADRGYGGPGYVNLINGRRRWFGYAEHTHKAMNQLIQGGLAESGKRWLVEAEQAEPGIILVQIHDSLVVEVDDNEAGLARARRVADIGEQVYQQDYGVRGRPMWFPIGLEDWSEKE